MKIIALLASLIALTGCTWVKVTPEGAAVQVLSIDDVSSCTSLGKVNAMSRAKVAGVSRSETKLATELETIARNNAATMGANAIAANGEINGNQQEFRAFQCPG